MPTNIELQSMIEELNEKSEQIGPKINSTKSKYQSNDIHQNQHIITINNRPLKKVVYTYLGQKIQITKNNLTANLSRRISLAWSAFGRMQDVFKSDIPNTIKARVSDQYPTGSHVGTETWVLIKNIINRFQVTQRAIERRILNINLQNHVTNTEIRKRTKVKDVRKNMCTKVELGGTYWTTTNRQEE